MAKAPSYQWFTRDWFGSSRVRRMNLAERGLYREMLDWQHEDGSVPDDPEQVSSMVGVPLADVEACWPRVRAMFEAVDGVLINRAFEEKEAAYKRFRKKRSQSGKKGNEVRWNRRAAKRQPAKAKGYSSDRNAIAKGSPASASASASAVEDQNLKFRERELRDAEIESNGFVALSEIPSVGAFLASINSAVAEREALDYDDIAYTLNAFFPPERPGAGTNPAVKAWLGRIPEQTIGSALRYLRAQTYTVEGEERNWGQLTDEHCKRLITAGLNAILRERG